MFAIGAGNARSTPQFLVQRAGQDGLADTFLSNTLAARQIGDGAGDFEAVDITPLDKRAFLGIGYERETCWTRGGCPMPEADGSFLRRPPMAGAWALLPRRFWNAIAFSSRKSTTHGKVTV